MSFHLSRGKSMNTKEELKVNKLGRIQLYPSLFPFQGHPILNDKERESNL